MQIGKTFIRLGIGLFAAVGIRSHADAAEAYLRVVDVGNGLCVVGTIPEGHSFVYDGGFRGQLCLNAVRQLVPSHQIDLLVLSHSDEDHITDVAAILGENRVGTILHPGDNRSNTIIDPMRLAISSEAHAGAQEINLATTALAPGHTFQLGDATITFIAGWSDGNLTRGTDDPPLPGPELRNTISIVVRLDYHGRSVLLTGDTIGRLGGESNSVCRYAERIMWQRRSAHPVASEVLVGQHHGGDNSSSNCFIRAVHPTYVVFSAGHAGYQHPRQSTADRFIANHVLPQNMLRTDRGDNEGGPEWLYGAIANCVDQAGDDDIEIFLPDNGQRTRVAYRVPSTGC